MPYFSLIYEVIDDFVARRAPFRSEYLRLAGQSRGRGEIVLAGALAEPTDTALNIFRCANKSTAEDFARRDPYVGNDLVKKWTVRPWSVVVGQDSETPPIVFRTVTVIACVGSGRADKPNLKAY